MNLLGQILTFVSYLVYWVSRFLPKKNKILIYDIFSRVIAIIGFLCLKTYSGIANSLFIIIGRNNLSRYVINKPFKIKLLAFILLLIDLLLLCFATNSGVATIFLLINSIINLYGCVMTSAQTMRILTMIGTIPYGFFMLYSYNMTGVVCEVICLLVNLISYLKYRKLYKIKQ